jgi:hypothetical protein
LRDGLLERLYLKSLSNHLAIAVSSSTSDPRCSIPNLAEALIETFKIDFSVESRQQYFQCWNELVKKAEEITDRPTLVRFVREGITGIQPVAIHRKIAEIPISNFIETTFDRSLHKALVAVGRKPILHDWNGQMMGIWKQSNPENPNLFFMLPKTEDDLSFLGIYEPISWWEQNRIQIENMREMLTDKDLLLIDFSAHEAEGVLHLHALDTAGGKIANYTPNPDGYENYWATRGVSLRADSPDIPIQRLQPYWKGKLGALNAPILGRYVIDVARLKQHDCFISYFSGDREFVKRLERDLRLREIRVWMDEAEIEIGDSISDKIQKGLSDSYSFMIVLSPEALTRPWVKEELRAAYNLRLAGEFKILPVLHKECEIPPFLIDYKYADFRDPKRYHEQLALLELSIKNAVKRAREKL